MLKLIPYYDVPGRITGYKRDDLKLLPSNTSKKVNTEIIIVTPATTVCYILDLKHRRQILEINRSLGELLQCKLVFLVL